MKHLPHAPEMLKVAHRVIWFEEPEKALENQYRFMAYVMSYGTIEDLKVVSDVVSADEYRGAGECPAGHL